MRKTCYIITDNVGSAVFLDKTRAEDVIRSIILDKMAELNFAAKVLAEFITNTRHSVAKFRAIVEELVVLAENRDSTVDGLLAAWNAIFTKDFIHFTEAELCETPPCRTPEITTQM